MNTGQPKRINGLIVSFMLVMNVLVGLVLVTAPAGAAKVEAPYQFFQMGNGCNDIVLVDVNGDDYPDMVTAQSLEARFNVRLNDGYGNFLSVTEYFVSYSSFSVMAADLDGDNDTDLAFANPGFDCVTVMYNTDGLGSFGGEDHFSVGNTPRNIFLTDVDLDLDLDIVTADRGDFSGSDTNVSVLENDGAGFFGNLAKYPVALEPMSIGAADLNGDGYPDVVTTHPMSENLSVILNDMSGGFLPPTIITVSYKPDYVYVDDLDLDGDGDVVFTDSDAEKLVVMKNDGTGNLAFHDDYTIGAGWDLYHRVKLADLDGDGDLDAVTPNDTDGTITVLINDGDGGYPTQFEFPTGPSPKSVGFGDIDQDGDIDIATAENYPPSSPWPPGRVSLYYNEGSGWFNLHMKFPTNYTPEFLDLGDLDGDGDLDVATANWGSWTNSVYFNRGGGSLGFRADYDTFDWPNTVRLVNIDNDNDLDMITGAGGGLTFPYVWVRKNDGHGNFLAEDAYLMLRTPQVFMADVNGDGLQDMITANGGDSSISVRLNDAAFPGNFSARSDYSSANTNQPRGIYMGDINNDNDIDIVISNPYEDNMEIYWNNGAGVFTAGATLYPTGAGPSAVIFADVDDDGDLDVASTNTNGDSVTVHLNRGNGIFDDGTATYPVGSGPKSIDAGDVDGDADIDFVVGNNGDDTITVLKNNGHGGFVLREDYAVLPNPLSVRLADIDQDVDLDIAYTTSNGFAFLYNRKSIDFHMDTDEDGFPDYADDFPDNNEEWVDSDGDGYGDNIDDISWNPFEYVDSDGDRHGDQFDDAFPQDPTEWSDIDGDGWGDNSDAFPQDNTEWLDSDNDTVGDNADFMPYDGSQNADTDGDGHGDNRWGTNGDRFPNDSTEWWDTDGDNYGDNIHDAFPTDNTQWSDSDGDSYGDNPGGNNPDMFPNNAMEWADNDGDGIGDNGDDDDDNDGYSDGLEQRYGNDTTDPNDYPPDHDGDYTPDDQDDDDDNDGFSDTIEQSLGYDSKNATDIPPDFDYDGIVDNSDIDIDGDGYINIEDDFPYNPAAWSDTDSDGMADEINEEADNPGNITEDPDDDNDGFIDSLDGFPTNPNEWSDTDGDGTGDNSDHDMDNDGWSNNIEEAAGSDPTDAGEVPMDTDSDGVANNADLDDDNDGVPDYDDYAPLDASIFSDPNLIRIAGVEFEIGELIMGIFMALGAGALGTFVVTRKKRLYTNYKNRIDGVDSVPELNSINTEIKSDREKERLTSIQLMLLKEQFDDKYMALREKELSYRLGKLPSKVEESVREIISDQIITEDEFEGMQKWLSRLRESKDFSGDKKAKLQEVLKDWIDENMDSDWDIDK